MLKSFESIKHHFKFRPSKPNIDNLIFKLHYRVTFLSLLVATILVCSREYIGEHIRCLVDDGVPGHVINTFCFFTSTFTLAQHYNDTLLEKEILPHPGVGPKGENDDVKHHAYYQWVPFVLFLQGIAFYMPHYIWRKKDGGRVRRMVDGLQMATLALHDKPIKFDDDKKPKVPSKPEIDAKITAIRVEFFKRLYATRSWATWLIGCEALNLANLMLQIYFTNKFLGGNFLDLGPKLFNVNWDGILDPLDIVFPKVTKCEFYKYGPSGTIQRHDALCVMALNIINEKIFSVLWFWYLILFVATSIGLIWRLITFCLHSRSAKFNEYVFYNACPGKLNPWNVLAVTRYTNFADWLFLYYLAKNMDGYVFKTLFVGLANELEKRSDPMTFEPVYSKDEHNMDTLKMEKEPLLEKASDTATTIDEHSMDTLKMEKKPLLEKASDTAFTIDEHNMDTLKTEKKPLLEKASDTASTTDEYNRDTFKMEKEPLLEKASGTAYTIDEHNMDTLKMEKKPPVEKEKVS